VWQKSGETAVQALVDEAALFAFIGQVLELDERHVEKTVTDPTERKTLLAKMGDFLKHPASTTVLQTALPELLKVLTP